MNDQVDYDSFDLTPFAVIVNDGELDALKQSVLAFAKNL